MVSVSALLLQTLFAAAIWAVPVSVAFIVVDAALSRLVRSAPRRALAYALIVLFLLSAIRTAYGAQSIFCPPPRVPGAEVVYYNCSYPAEVAGIFVDSLLRSAYVTILLLIFGLVGYVAYRAAPIENRYARMYIGSFAALLTGIAFLEVFPWSVAVWLSF